MDETAPTAVFWPHDDVAALDAIETGVLEALLPPLNLSKVTKPWGQQVRGVHKKLATQSREWNSGDCFGAAALRR